MKIFLRCNAFCIFDSRFAMRWVWHRKNKVSYTKMGQFMRYEKRRLLQSASFLCRCVMSCGALLCLLTCLGSCSNDPYPSADRDQKILYGSFDEAPKTLDPAVAYTTASTAITGNVYDTLLEYHYLKRPYELMPSLAQSVPKAEPQPDGKVLYRFRLQEGLLFQNDSCFEKLAGAPTRAVLAQDFAFELQRIADPSVASPVITTFEKIVGFMEFSQALAKRREGDANFAKLPAHEQYTQIGGISGVRVASDRDLEILLSEAYPQILYWFAMPFTAPIPWEAIAYYDGQDGREHFQDHPVGAGPYRLSVYAKRHRMILEKNQNWYGVRYPERHAPGATYPREGEPGDFERGLLDPAYVGRALPFIERIEFRREQEGIPAFGKFLQGYYDASGIIRESFDKVVRGDELSPEMAARGMKLEKSVSPDVYYIGFNMDDSTVGHSGGERAKKLRQAMSLAIDAQEFVRIFNNGRGVPAQSLLPPGIFGYDANLRNSYRQVDLERAKQLLVEAGYAGGIDATTKKPLHLTFDSPDPSAQGLLRFQFFVNAWRKLGLDVEISATTYNQFQEKVDKGAYQIFMWGWVADYPDPENFMFLLWTPMGRTASGGPNTANFSNPRYDELFVKMSARESDAERLVLIREMQTILEDERPWIELFHREDYALYHPWFKNVKPAGLSIATAKYRDIDTKERSRLRAEWNAPIVWPLYVILIAAVAIVFPAVVTFYRERQ